MGIHFLIFLAINAYFIWRLTRLIIKRRKNSKKRFFVVVGEEVDEPPENEWQRKIRAEIEEMTKQ